MIIIHSNQVICTKTNGDNEQISFMHASILDAYKENLSDFVPGHFQNLKIR